MELSYSLVEKYQKCPRSYYHHYVERVRPITQRSSLFFGKCYGQAVQAKLLQKKDPAKLTDEEKILVVREPIEYFEELMNTTDINDEVIDLPKSDRVWYYASDLQTQFLTPEEWELIRAYALELKLNFDPYFTGLINNYFEFQKSGIKDLNVIKAVNYLAWFCCVKRGKIMINLFMSQIYPKIKTVLSIEEKIELPNESGDLIIGYIDLICIMEINSKDEIVIFDNKTSSTKYPKIQTKTFREKARQLDLYSSNFPEIKYQGFLVVTKKPNSINVLEAQILFEEIDINRQDEVLNSMTEVLELIHQEKFEKNESGCFQFGAKCDFWDYCKHNNKDGLMVKPKKEVTNG